MSHDIPGLIIDMIILAVVMAIAALIIRANR